ncbi:DMT family transporter [Roseivivax isoporae]|uniref:Membrane protein n=1 Tax=Roseivivax isoporae LMG 25204 TaxID=1449351 RepID=X7FCM1_9RHOB|nr:DMT family transporter [Roseivivax isoporae]ETX29809.1 membrane protein [Roseivivax isoporae LMG 25204]
MDNLRGIALMVLAMAGFAIEDAFIKGAAATLPTGQILLTIGVVGGGIFALVAKSRGVRLISPVLLTPALLCRTAAEMVATISFVTAITLIPLAMASAIIQAVPLALAAGASLIFGEVVGWRRWSAILSGLVGVIVILRPGLEGFDVNALWAVLAVFGLAARDLAVRAVPATVGHLQLATYGLLTCVLSGLVLIPFTGLPVRPDPYAAAMLAGASIMGVFAYYAITAAARTGAVAVVTPFRYTRILFAIVVGLVAFSEVPDAATLAGAGLVVASGVYTLLRERSLARAAARRDAGAA